MLQETKCDKDTMNKITKNIWKNCEIECIEEEGAFEELEILWDLGIMEVEVISQLPSILMI
jgi:hypothetical protein